MSVHWYGIMYLLAFLCFLVRGNWLARHRTWWGWSTQDVSDFLFYAMIGEVVGGRMGYVFFYALDSLLQDPMFLFKINQGGMSFHGGLVGVMLASGWFARRTHRTFWQGDTDSFFAYNLARTLAELDKAANGYGEILLFDIQTRTLTPTDPES